ncbi:MAG: hypothetical protein ACOC4C_00210 [Fibrobacterota bacterium]
MKRVLILYWLLVAIRVYGQGIQWPEALVIGELSCLELNPHQLEVMTEQTLYSKTFTSQNELSLFRQTDLYTLAQQFTYSVERDGWLGSTNHFADMRGRALLKQNKYIDKIGIEWMPLSSYYSQQDGNVFQTLIDIGPVVQLSPFDIPIVIHGGLSAIAWNKQFPKLKQLITNELNDTLGIYGGFDIGKTRSRLGELPLYFNGSFQGRAVEGAREIRANAGLLFATRIHSGDSLFAFFGDTVSDGNDAFLSQGIDQWGGYINSPRTLEHSLQFTGGVKGVERNGIKPAFHYSFNQYSLQYPTDKDLLNDVRNRMHRVALGLQSSEILDIDYRGNIFFCWEEDDKLFNLESIDDRSEQIVNIRDYDVFSTEMNHSLSKTWANNLGFDYSLHLSRYLRQYPLTYTSGSDTLESNDDYDEVVKKHDLSISVLPFEKVHVDLIGGYAVNYLFLLKAEQSDRSYIDRRYEVGLRAEFKLSESFIVEEELMASTDQKEFKFKLNRGRFPEYSRTMFSDLKAKWNISDSWSLQCQWVRSDWDNGYWDAAEYRDTIIDTLARDDYYAIQYKSTDQTVIVTADCLINEYFKIRGGCEFRDVYFREFRNGEYIINDLGAGYFAGPFIRFNIIVPQPVYLGKSVTLTGHIRRSIDNIADDFWDVSFTFETVF